MVVDGEVLVRNELAAYLRDCGYKVVEAASTDEAVLFVSEAKLQVDAILCDVRIGGQMNGFTFRKWVREHHPDLDVLLAGDLEKAADAAADLCEQGPQLTRPYAPSSVADRIKRQLAERDRRRNK